MAPRPNRERGCGCGCAVALLAAVIILLCIVMPWIGLPLGLVAATVAITIAWLSDSGPFAKSRDDEPKVVETDAGTHDPSAGGGEE